MNLLVTALVPELILVSIASLLMLAGATASNALRRLAPWMAVFALVAAAWVVTQRMQYSLDADLVVPPIVITGMSQFIKVLVYFVGILLVLVNWPSNADPWGNSSLSLDREGPEYFGLMLLSFTGVSLLAGADDLILLFLGVELASIPTYIMLSMSRPIAAAQEAAVKYFFLGAFSAALTLFGLSFLFGVTGSLSLTGIETWVAADNGAMSPWLMIAGLMALLGLAFKLAAFPMHFYAPDVYTGAATPMTALLSFVPKTAGLVAVIKVLFAIRGGQDFAISPTFVSLLWVIAVASMTIGNVLGLMQHNIKRMMACSSIAHSGYMLVGVLVAMSTTGDIHRAAMQGILFYLTAYGLMNVGVFAVLMMIPPKADPFAYDGKVPPATTAETFAELAGAGRRDPVLGLIMTVCCLSLIGIPLTVGFFGKLLLIRPALMVERYWLVVILVLNAAISATYYLRLISAMFLREPRQTGQTLPGATPGTSETVAPIPVRTTPLMLAGVISAAATLLLGTAIPATTALMTRTQQSVTISPALREAKPTPDGSVPQNDSASLQR